MDATNETVGGTKRSRGKVPYFLQPAKSGAVAVLRKPCGNRATPKVCGVMPTRAQALALVKQLMKAESAVDDLFYEATDDGIEALEAILQACCESVLARGQRKENGRENGEKPAGQRAGRRRRRGRNGRRPAGESMASGDEAA